MLGRLIDIKKKSNETSHQIRTKVGEKYQKCSDISDLESNYEIYFGSLKNPYELLKENTLQNEDLTIFTSNQLSMEATQGFYDDMIFHVFNPKSDGSYWNIILKIITIDNKNGIKTEFFIWLFSIILVNLSSQDPLTRDKCWALIEILITNIYKHGYRKYILYLVTSKLLKGHYISEKNWISRILRAFSNLFGDIKFFKSFMKELLVFESDQLFAKTPLISFLICTAINYIARDYHLRLLTAKLHNAYSDSQSLVNFLSEIHGPENINFIWNYYETLIHRNKSVPMIVIACTFNYIKNHIHWRKIFSFSSRRVYLKSINFILHHLPRDSPILQNFVRELLRNDLIFQITFPMRVRKKMYCLQVLTQILKIIDMEYFLNIIMDGRLSVLVYEIMKKFDYQTALKFYKLLLLKICSHKLNNPRDILIMRIFGSLNCILQYIISYEKRFWIKSPVKKRFLLISRIKSLL